VISLLGGLGGALFFAIAILAGSRSSRLIGPAPAAGWMFVIGLTIALPLAIATGAMPAGLGGPSTIWIVAAGSASVVAQTSQYRAMRVGPVGLLAPIIATQGAIAALFAVALGEPLRGEVGAALVVIVAGVVVATLSPGDSTVSDSAHGPRFTPLLHAFAAAVAFGVSLVATGRLGNELSPAWALLPSRVLGVAIVAIPLAARSRLVLTRKAVPFVIAAGAAETAGVIAFVLGAEEALAVSAVLVTQFATITTAVAWLLFDERFSRRQVIGVAMVIVGVSVVAAVQA
jgi:drug/metabolite transporter (DMT)-like permease